VELLRHHGLSRISIGINLSDGVPNSLLEAMLMGALPIESEGSCANEWIEHEKTGFIVPPEDPQTIAGAIKAALWDDGLVDRAAVQNQRVIEERMEVLQIRMRAINMYRGIAEGIARL
jgi:glycosyltransferase involved in cell wall biosynthesis